MKKTVGCTILSAALLSGLALPAQALGMPGADPAEGSPTGTVQLLATTAAPAAAAMLRPALRIGARSPAVVYVQTELGVKPASGYYGPITAKAVRAVQKRHGLPVTGTVAASTWKVLLRSASTSAPVADPAPASIAAPGTAPATSLTPEQAARTRPSLAVGSRGPAVIYIQNTLRVTPATGYFGPLTTAAVARLQASRGMPATGSVTALTWEALLGRPEAPSPSTDDVRPVAGKPAGTPTPVSAPALTPAQAAAQRPALSYGLGPNPAVVFIQQYLRVTPTTGYFGNLTRGAVRAYQSSLGISVTGTVGPLTWAAIHAGRTATPSPNPVASTSTTSIPTPKHPLPENPTAGDRAVVFALAQVGKPYVLGGNGPAVFDCSGLVQQAYLTAKVTLPRLASQQRFAGTEVSIDALLPGDLLYYQDGSSPRKGHISMYVGNGLVVEAANPRRGVRIRTLHEAWYRDRFVAAVRIG